MFHSVIKIENLLIGSPKKTCFDCAFCEINYRDRIAIIGRNGCGKTTLLKALLGQVEVKGGKVLIPQNVEFGYVPQVIDDNSTLSGGERVNLALTKALAKSPNVLLLDEPTNHLDARNRKSVMRMLQNFDGTVIMVSHDECLLRAIPEIFWYIDDEKLEIFRGNYEDLVAKINQGRDELERKLLNLEKRQREIFDAQEREKERAASSKRHGEKNIRNRKWIAAVSDNYKNSAEKASGKAMSTIKNEQANIREQLSKIHAPEVIEPKFSIGCKRSSNGAIVSIVDGSVGYFEGSAILSGVRLTLFSKQRLAIIGRNGSGKTTFCVL